MVWAAERLTKLKVSLDPVGLNAALERQSLFPDPDNLYDPEGEPPTNPYGY